MTDRRCPCPPDCVSADCPIHDPLTAPEPEPENASLLPDAEDDE